MVVDELQKLKAVFSDNIYSLVRYGFGKRHFLVVLKQADFDYLHSIKPYVRKLLKTSTVIVTSKEDISHSLGIDFLNIQLTSTVLYGKDPFKGVKVDTARLKRQIRYEANKTLIALRNEYLSKRWNYQLRLLLYSSVPRLLPLVVAHLYVLGCKIPNAIPDTINRYVKYNPDAAVLLHITPHKKAKDLDPLFANLFSFLETLSKKV